LFSIYRNEKSSAIYSQKNIIQIVVDGELIVFNADCPLVELHAASLDVLVARAGQKSPIGFLVVSFPRIA
jgi:hypothetical protein